jgi:hypothetical protein
MPRKMYDSTRALDIPADAQMVAGYVDGAYKWSGSDWQHWAHVRGVGIATSAATNDGRVLDVETGDATAIQAPGWVTMRRAAGVDPSVYCNLSTWASVRQAFQRLNVPEPYYWIASWDEVYAPLADAIAKQYDHPPHSGGHYDLSWVADYWPGVDPPPSSGGGGAPPPPPPPPPAPPPPPVPPSSQLDATRAAWQNLANVLTVDLPNAVNELMRVLGLYQNS